MTKPRSAGDFTRSAKISPVPEHHHTPSRFDVRRRSAKPDRWTSIGEFGESLSVSFQSRCRRRVVAGRARACSLESTSSVRVRVAARRRELPNRRRTRRRTRRSTRSSNRRNLHPGTRALSSTGGNCSRRGTTSSCPTGTLSYAPTATPSDGLPAPPTRSFLCSTGTCSDAPTAALPGGLLAPPTSTS